MPKLRKSQHLKHLWHYTGLSCIKISSKNTAVSRNVLMRCVMPRFYTRDFTAFLNCAVSGLPLLHDWQSYIWTGRIKSINHTKLGDKKWGKIKRGSKFNWEHWEKIEVKKYRRLLPVYRAIEKWSLAGFSFGWLHKFISNDCRSETSVRFL